MTTRHKLTALLDQFAQHAEAETVTLGSVTDALGASGFSILCAVVSLPLLMPVSLGPLATAGGLALAVLGLQILGDSPHPRLPAWIRKVEMPRRAWSIMSATLVRVVTLCARLSRPRLRRWTSGRGGRLLRGSLIVAASLLMAVPLFGVPFNNALPALAIFLVCLADLQEDGLLAWIAVVVAGISAVYILGCAFLIVFFGHAALAALLH